NILATEIGAGDPNAKHCSVDPKSISVKADATEASFDIKANAAWTAVSDNDAFKVEPASGEGDATVTVKFSANEGDAARVANIKVSCPDASFEATVVVTQAKPSSGEAVVVSVDFTAENPDLPQGSAAGLKDGTYKLGGYEFIIHAADKFYQAKSNEQFYLLFGKQGSYVQFPVIDGKALTKVEFLTGAGASENVIADIAKADGTRLNVNNDKLKKGTNYSWEVSGEPGVAYRFLVTNGYNAQFQNLTLTYE
ncbi:MAG: BACON domain-containing protein, partial [Bacteroidales bacterium]|nr:BACON domain-containing protein [Bacteroidales bacterium]